MSHEQVTYPFCAMLMSQSPDGRHSHTRARGQGKTIVVDFNQPLAGKTLNFDVKVTDIKSAATR